MPGTLLYGFHDKRDILNRRLTDEIIPTVNTLVQDAIRNHNLVTAQMIALFTTETNEYKIRYRSPYAAAKLQPLDEIGRPRKIKSTGFYDLGFPIKKAGLAFGWTREARIKMTVQDVNDALAQMLEADKRWMRDQIMAALFTNTQYTFQDEEHGALTVLPLANGDSQEYLIRAGMENGETANHFLAQAAAIADGTNPFPTIYRALTKRPENNDGRVIVFVPGNLRASVEALTAFIEESDPDLTLGVNTTRLTGALGASVPGEVMGKVDRCWVVCWESLPDNYMVALCTGGDRPIAIRQHPEAELRGFQAVADRQDHPFFERIYERQAGFGAWNRVGAAVMLIGSASYTAPSGLTQPSI